MLTGNSPSRRPYSVSTLTAGAVASGALQAQGIPATTTDGTRASGFLHGRLDGEVTTDGPSYLIWTLSDRANRWFDRLLVLALLGVIMLLGWDSMGSVAVVLARPTAPSEVAVALARAVAILVLDLHHLQGLRVDLGLEGVAMGIRATDLIAAVVDLEPLHLPALGYGHLKHGFARLPLLHRGLAVVIGQGGPGCQAEGQDHQAVMQEDEAVHDGGPFKRVVCGWSLRM